MGAPMGRVALLLPTVKFMLVNIKTDEHMGGDASPLQMVRFMMVNSGTISLVAGVLPHIQTEVGMWVII
jgi:hypothetical protein